MRPSPALAALLILASAVRLTAAPPTTNPADLETVAMRQLHDPADLLHTADDPETMPLDAAVAAYVDKRRPTLDLLRQAGAMPHAEWGPYGEIGDVLTSLNDVRAAARMTWLAARYDAANGRPGQATDDLLAGLSLARHTGQRPLLVHHLVETGCVGGAIDRLAKLLPTLPADVVATLPAKLDALPPSAGWPAVIDGERAFGRRTLAKRLAGPGGPANADLARRQEAAAAAMSDGLVPVYDALKGRPGETPAGLQRDLDAALAKMPLNLMAKIVAPSFCRARECSATVEAKWAMLRTAVALAAGDPAALAASRDPFGDGPFVRTETPGGYTLAGKLTNKDGPETLTIAR